MLGRVHVVTFEGPDIPGCALRSFGQLSVGRRGIGEENVVGGVLVDASEVELADVQIAVSSDPIERFITASRAGNWHSILSQEVSRTKSADPINPDPLQSQFAKHECLAEVQVAVITATARQAQVAVGAADQ